MFPVVLLVAASFTRWGLLWAHPVEPLPIDDKVLGPGEQGGLLGGAEPFLPGEVPACWPVGSWSGFLLLGLNQDRGSPLVFHVGDASLQ